MPHIEELDPDIVRQLLDEETDKVSSISEVDEQLYLDAVCPRCENQCRKSGLAPGGVVQRFLLECLGCGCVFNPHSGMIVAMGNLAKAYVPGVPLINP